VSTEICFLIVQKRLMSKNGQLFSRLDNYRPWKMDWWAYPLVGLPFLLLADDAFHFLPKDGPLGFLIH
jgi:hypothetical protein